MTQIICEIVYREIWRKSFRESNGEIRGRRIHRQFQVLERWRDDSTAAFVTWLFGVRRLFFNF